MSFRLLLPLLLVLLVGCSRDPVTVAQEATAGVVVPVVVAAREVVEPIAPPLPAPAITPWECPTAIDLIVQFEVISSDYYERRLQGVICPPAASGPTWGIGYDGGHQTRARILGDWTMHPDAGRLVETSGVTGQAACRPLVATQLGDVRTPLALARSVFAASTLPLYDARAARLYGDAWQHMWPCTRGALRSVHMNRGTGTAGDSRREIRVMRDDCAPRSHSDPSAAAQCIAAQLRAMVRVWIGTDIEAGMRRRRHAEADLAVREG